MSLYPVNRKPKKQNKIDPKTIEHHMIENQEDKHIAAEEAKTTATKLAFKLNHIKMIESANFQNNNSLPIEGTALISLKKPSLAPIKLWKFLKKLRGKWIVIKSLQGSSRRKKIVSLSISKKGCSNKLRKLLIKPRSTK